MRVLGLIPARGGSKAIERKNIRKIAGKPLLIHTVESALDASRLTRIVLSTDDEEIAEIGMESGVEVPFRRPPELAQDDSPMFSVVRHALETLSEMGDEFDAICLLQPTSPARPPGLIDASIETLEEGDADCVMTVLPVPPAYNPNWVYLEGSDGCLYLSSGAQEPPANRQDLPVAYHREGSVYVSRSRAIRDGSLYGRCVVGLVVDPDDSVNIDEPADWKRAEEILRKKVP